MTACAAAFLAEAERGDPQEVMARWTGRYRRERTAKKPPAQRPSLTAAAGRE